MKLAGMVEEWKHKDAGEPPRVFVYHGKVNGITVEVVRFDNRRNPAYQINAFEEDISLGGFDSSNVGEGRIKALYERVEARYDTRYGKRQSEALQRARSLIRG